MLGRRQPTSNALVDTLGAQGQPAAFSFTASCFEYLDDAPEFFSETITLTGTFAGRQIITGLNCTGYSLNGAAYTTAVGIAKTGDTLAIKCNNPGTGVIISVRITVGTTQGTWTVYRAGEFEFCG